MNTALFAFFQIRWYILNVLQPIKLASSFHLQIQYNIYVQMKVHKPLTNYLHFLFHNFHLHLTFQSWSNKINIYGYSTIRSRNILNSVIMSYALNIWFVQLTAKTIFPCKGKQTELLACIHTKSLGKTTKVWKQCLWK